MPSPPLKCINTMRAKNMPYSTLYCLQHLRKLSKLISLAETELKSLQGYMLGHSAESCSSHVHPETTEMNEVRRHVWSSRNMDPAKSQTGWQPQSVCQPHRIRLGLQEEMGLLYILSVVTSPARKRQGTWAAHKHTPTTSIYIWCSPHVFLGF